MPDLFGNPDRMEARQESAPSAVSLFDATAERIAYEGGRNVAQVATELRQPTPEALPDDGLFVVGKTTWGFDANGKYRTMPAKAKAKA